VTFTIYQIFQVTEIKKFMNKVLVLSSTKKPLMPCHPARARELLRKGKAAVYRIKPFTIILKFRADGELQNIEFKIDPDSKTTGVALVAENTLLVYLQLRLRVIFCQFQSTKNRLGFQPS
jgi:hypothetical protein